MEETKETTRTFNLQTVTNVLTKAPDVLGVVLEEENRKKLQEAWNNVGEMSGEVEDAMDEIKGIMQEAVDSINVLSKQAASALCDVLVEALQKAGMEIDWPITRELVDEAEAETRERFKRALRDAVETSMPF